MQLVNRRYDETLAESEKTFYTVRRQNRALYAARTVFAFPTASTNAMYRFGRLAVKYPGRSAGFMRNYYGLYSTFGVDKDGNPVSNPTKLLILSFLAQRKWACLATKASA